MLEWLRFAVALVMMAFGLVAFLTTSIGLYRYSYVLNRIHVAAKCDTAGMMLCLGSLIVKSGLTMTSLRLLMLIVFLWIANPVASHLIAYLEIATNPRIDEEFEVIRNDVA